MMEKLVEEIIDQLEKKKRVTVGVVSEPLKAAFIDHRKRVELADIETDIDVLMYRKQAILGQITEEEVNKLQEELNKRVEALNKGYREEKGVLWEQVYKELGITDKGKKYTISQKTGEVTTLETKTE